MTRAVTINTAEIPDAVAESLFRNLHRAIKAMREDPRYKDLYEQYLKEEMEKCHERPITASLR